MTERVGRAVLELGADPSGLFETFGQAKAGARGIDSEFEKLRRRSQGLGADFVRMVSRFQGRKIVDEARLMAQAVERVGGVSRLTRGELDQVARTVGAATDKLRRMGEEVPPSLRKLQTEISLLDRAGGRAAAGGLGSLSGALSGVRALLPAISAIGAVGLIGRLASDALQASDSIVKYSTSLGVSIETTQRWQHVAGQTSTTLEAFGNAARVLGVNLATGSNRTREALKDLNLSWQELRNAKPEEQFNRAIAALEGVESITERNRLGQALFGKQWKEISVAVAEGYTRIASEAAVAGEAQVRAAEAAGDAWEKAKQRIGAAAIGIVGRLAQEFQDTPIDVDRLSPEQLQHYNMLLKAQGDAYGYLLDLERERTKGMRDHNLEVEAGTTGARDYVAQLAAIRAEVASLSDAQKAQIRAAQEAGESQSDIAETLEVSEGAIRLYLKQVEESTKKQREAREAAEKFAESVRRIPIAFKGWLTIPETVRDTREAIDEVRASMDAMADIRPLGDVWEPFKKGAEDSKKKIREVLADIKFGKAFRDGLIDAVAEIPAILQRSLEGGGGLQGALQSIATQIGSQIGTAIGGAIGTAIGGPTGGRIGSQIGAVVGLIPGALIGRIGREERHVNDLRDAAFAAAGGFHALHQRLDAAGFAMERLLRARDAATWEREWAAANAALERHQELLEEQERQLEANRDAARDLFDEILAMAENGIPDALRPAIEQLISLGLLTEEQAERLRGLASDTRINTRQMEEDIGLFQGRLESLGPAFAQAKIDETAMKYANAIDRMIAAGGDVGGLLFDAKEELGALAAEAIRTGRTLPENLRPWIEDLVRSGNLIDENGQRITDISGIKWGERMETEGEKTKKIWDQILAKISELVERLTGPVEDAIDRATRDRRVNIDVEVRERIRRDDEHHTQPAHFSTGIFRGRFGAAGRLARLHDIESVVPRRDELAFASRILAERRMVASSATTNNNTSLLPILMVREGTPTQMARDVMRKIRQSGLPLDTEGLRTAVEHVIADWMRTYAYAR